MRGPLILLLALLAGCSTQEDQFSSAPPSLHVGEVALGAGEPGIAVSVANLQLERDPNNLDAVLLRSKAQAAIGQTEGAVAGFRQVLAAQPGSLEAALGLSRLITATDPAGAESLLAPFVVSDNTTPAVWNNLGVARDLLNRHAEAQDAYRKALEADPAMQGAQVNLARSLSLTTRPASKAVAQNTPQPQPAPVLAAVAQPAPPAPPPAATVPVLASATPQPEPAAPQLASPPATVNEAQQATARGTPEQPQSLVDQANSCDALVPQVDAGQTSENPVVQWLQAAIGLDQTARRVAEANLQCHPSSLEAHRAPVYAAIDAGDFHRALEISFDAVRLAPDDARSYLMVADTQRAMGDKVDALDNLRKARSLIHP